ncbi:MAG: YaeQ family protein [Burkholderiaceae bacterium]
MALGATICKLELSVADMDRHYYQSHLLTLAQHPSENSERLMLRVLAFVMFADDSLAFGRGVSTDDEPDLWVRDLTGHIQCWVDLGMPDDKRIRKACGRAGLVEILTYGGTKASLWYERMAAELERFDNLRIWSVSPDDSRALARLANRAMKLDASIQDGQILVAGNSDSVQIEPVVVKERRAR